MDTVTKTTTTTKTPFNRAQAATVFRILFAGISHFVACPLLAPIGALLVNGSRRKPRRARPRQSLQFLAQVSRERTFAPPPSDARDLSARRISAVGHLRCRARLVRRTRTSSRVFSRASAPVNNNNNTNTNYIGVCFCSSVRPTADASQRVATAAEPAL